MHSKEITTRFQQAFHGTLAVPGNAATPVATVPSSGRVSKLIGSVRCNKAVTLTVYQCPVTVGESTTWLHKTDEMEKLDESSRE